MRRRSALVAATERPIHWRWDQNSAANNFGADSILKAQSKSPRDNFRALVRFGLPTAVPSGCMIESATLRMHSPSWSNGRTLQALRLNGSWPENAATWNNQPAAIGPAATSSSGSGYRAWNVTGQVQAIYSASANHGFLIRDAVEDASGAEQQFHSREKGQSLPQRVVRFVQASAAATGTTSFQAETAMANSIPNAIGTISKETNMQARAEMRYRVHLPLLGR